MYVYIVHIRIVCMHMLYIASRREGYGTVSTVYMVLLRVQGSSPGNIKYCSASDAFRSHESP